MPNMDWKKETGNPVYPTGTYHVHIVSWEKCESTSKKTPQVQWKAEIMEPDEHRGRSIVDYTALTEKALWRIGKLVAACGVNTEKCGVMDTSSPQFDAVLDACKERNVFWRVTEEIYDGVNRNKIVDYVADPEQEIIEPAPLDKIEW